ncbi:hypothetical protein B0A48_02191 [Cryoendolithus antarcticus]|uniref:Heterokaryon incompatibility domain-containing protein n=1 Tax=Cryoendolithus antarcticus TaxID=1507870 RepID=A0A1V8TMX0_9PEZI|nr:hypothetical protein B0A48_02191 [Cryoendolithus antarcticus]
MFLSTRELAELKAPLTRRKWALQERLLSRRIVHFSATELVWQCRQQLLCECDFSDLDNTWYMNNYNAALVSGNSSLKEDQWSLVVSTYTRADITNKNDTLPAIAGLARVYGASGLGRYHAGLWNSMLPGALCWRTSKNHSHLKGLSVSDPTWRSVVCRRAEQYVAPTWSWASVVGSVDFAWNSSMKTVARVVNVKCTSVNGDDYGRLAAGYIEIEAHVHRSTSEWPPGHDFRFDTFDDLKVAREASHSAFALIALGGRSLRARSYGIALAARDDVDYCAEFGEKRILKIL